jgi:hypothetical protein
MDYQVDAAVKEIITIYVIKVVWTDGMIPA